MTKSTRLFLALAVLAVAHLSSAGPAEATPCNDRKCINPWGCHNTFIDCHCEYWSTGDECYHLPCTTGEPCNQT